MPHPIQVEFKTTPGLSGEESLLSPDNPFSDIIEQLPQEDRFEPAFKPPQNPFSDILEQLPKEDQPQKGLLPAGNPFQDIEETLSGSVDIQPEDDIDVIINDQQIRSVPRQIPQGDLEAGETPTPSPPDQRTNVGIIRQTKAKEPQNITGVSVIDFLIDFTDIGIIKRNIEEFNKQANRISELQDKQLKGVLTEEESKEVRSFYESAALALVPGGGAAKLGRGAINKFLGRQVLKVSNFIGKLVPESVKRQLIPRFKQPQEYISLDIERAGNTILDKIRANQNIKVLKQLSGEERLLAGEALKGRTQGVPIQIINAVKPIRTQIDRLSKELSKELDPKTQKELIETINSNVGQYVRRVYARDILGSDFAPAPEAIAAAKDYLKKNMVVKVVSTTKGAKPTFRPANDIEIENTVQNIIAGRTTGGPIPGVPDLAKEAEKITEKLRAALQKTRVITSKTRVSKETVKETSEKVKVAEEKVTKVVTKGGPEGELATKGPLKRLEGTIQEAMERRGFSAGEAQSAIRKIKGAGTTEGTAPIELIETTIERTKTIEKTSQIKTTKTIIEEIRSDIDLDEATKLGLESLRDLAARMQRTPGFATRGKRIDLSPFKRRRDIPEPIRQLMGEVEEGGYAGARTVADLSATLNNMRFFKNLAKTPEWVSDVAKEGFTRRPLPDSAVYGPLRGKFVLQNIADDLSNMVRGEPQNIAEKFYFSWLNAWKFSKTVLNPATHGRNVMGNVVFSDLADVSPFNPVNAKFYRNALNSLLKEDTLFEEAVKHGAIGTEAVSQELKPILRSFLNQRGGYVQRMMNVAAQFSDKTAHIYNLEDQVPKLASYIKQRSLGFSSREAAALVNKWFPNYRDLAPLVKRARGTPLGTVVSSPFISFTSEAIRIYGNAFKEKPVRFFKWAVTIPASMIALSAYSQGMTLEDLNKVWTALPTNQKFKYQILLPWRDKDGSLRTFDLSYILPLGDILQTAGIVDVPLLSRLVGGNPIILTAAQIRANKNFFTGGPIARLSDVSQFLSNARFAAEGVLPIPSFASSLGRLSERVGLAEFGGKEKSAGEALKNIFTPFRTDPVDQRLVAKRAEIFRTRRELLDDLKRIAFAVNQNRISRSDAETKRDRILKQFENLKGEMLKLRAATPIVRGVALRK